MTYYLIIVPILFVGLALWFAVNTIVRVAKHYPYVEKEENVDKLSRKENGTN